MNEGIQANAATPLTREAFMEGTPFTKLKHNDRIWLRAVRFEKKAQTFTFQKSYGGKYWNDADGITMDVSESGATVVSFVGPLKLKGQLIFSEYVQVESLPTEA
jgi:hypothetical protein